MYTYVYTNYTYICIYTIKHVLMFLTVQTSQAVEDINSICIRSGSLIGGIIGGIAIGAVITVIIYKIIFKVPNRDTFNKKKEKRTNKK